MKRLALAALLCGALGADFAFGASAPFLKQVKELMQAKNYSKAITLIAAELRSKPQEYQLWLAMGYCRERMQQKKEALDAFKRARTLNPKIPGINSRIGSIEEIRKIGQAGKEDEYLTPEQKKAKKLFAKVIKDKGYGRFDEAFAAFPECVDLNPAYLNGNDEGVIAAGLNFFQEKLERGDRNARFMLSVYLYFKGDYTGSEDGLNKFIDMKPAPELIEKAKKYLKLIVDQREVQSQALSQAQGQAQGQAPVKVPIKTNVKTAGTVVGSASWTTAPAPLSPASSAAVQAENAMAGVPSESDREALERSLKADRSLAAKEAETLIKEYQTANQARQGKIIWEIGMLRTGSAETLSFFEERLASKDYLVYVFSLEALRKIGHDAAPLAPQIIKGLDGVKDQRIVNALNTLGRIQASDEETLKYLAKNLSSGKNALRNVSFKSLVRIGEPAVPFLIEEKNKTTTAEDSKQSLGQIISQIKGISTDEAMQQ